MSSQSRHEGSLLWLKKSKFSKPWDRTYCEVFGPNIEDPVGLVTTSGKNGKRVNVLLSETVDAVSMAVEQFSFPFGLLRADTCKPFILAADTDTSRQEWLEKIKELIYAGRGLSVYGDQILERVTIPPTPYCKCKGLVGRHFAAVHQGRLLLFETISLEQLWSIELNSTENIEQDASGEVRIYFSEKSGRSKKTCQLSMGGMRDMNTFYCQLTGLTGLTGRCSSLGNSDSTGSAACLPDSSFTDEDGSAGSTGYMSFDQHQYCNDFDSPKPDGQENTISGYMTFDKHEYCDDIDALKPDKRDKPSSEYMSFDQHEHCDDIDSPKPDRRGPITGAESDSGMSGDDSITGHEDEATNFEWWHKVGRDKKPQEPHHKVARELGRNSVVARSAIEFIMTLPEGIAVTTRDGSLSKDGNAVDTPLDALSTKSTDSCLAVGCVRKEEERATPEEIILTGSYKPKVPPMSTARRELSAAMAGKSHVSPLPPLPATPAPVSPPAMPEPRALPTTPTSPGRSNSNPGCPEPPPWSEKRRTSYEQHEWEKQQQTSTAPKTKSLDRQCPPPPLVARHSQLQMTTSAPPPLPKRQPGMALQRRSHSTSTLRPLGHHGKPEERKRLASAPLFGEKLEEVENGRNDRSRVHSLDESRCPDQVYAEEPYQYYEAKNHRRHTMKNKRSIALSGVLGKLKGRSASLSEDKVSTNELVASPPEMSRSISLNETGQMKAISKRKQFSLRSKRQSA